MADESFFSLYKLRPIH